MKKKSKLVTILIVLATLVLAGIAVYTAVRLYQLRQESVSPAAPESEPAAAAPVTESCDVLAFNLAGPTTEPTTEPTDEPTTEPTDAPTTAPTTPGATAEPTLPEAGVSLPTIIGASAGTLLIILSLILAI